MRKKVILFFLLFIFIVGVFGGTPLWMRYPAISPDGEKIVFSYMDDLYIVNSKGGKAKQLTTHKAHDSNPIWSPDGKRIAFTSMRYGNNDIFIISSEGGIPERLTFHSEDEIPYSFSQNGELIIFGAHLEDDSNNAQFPSGTLPEIYSLSINDNKLKRIITTPAEDINLNKSESLMLYHDIKGFENRWRKHHKSSITRDIWKYDFKTKKHKKLISYVGEDRTPRFDNEEKNIYYLTEKYGSFNIAKYSLKKETSKQITFHKNHPVRFLTLADNNTLCYSYNGEIYIKKDNKKSEKVNIEIKTDRKRNPFDFIKVNSNITDMDISPDGNEIAFIIRGEIFVTSSDYNTTKRITNTPEQERSVNFSPDGRHLIYAGERNNSWNIYKTEIVEKNEKYFTYATRLKEKAIIETEEETFQPKFSPDGEKIAYLENRTILKILDLSSNESRTVLPDKYNYSYSDGDILFNWSPDSKWLAVEYLAKNSRWSTDIGLVDIKGEKLINLTKSGYEIWNPRWFSGGSAIIYMSNKDGMRNHGGWGSLEDVYAVFLNKKSFEEFTLSEEEYKLRKGELFDKKKWWEKEKEEQEKEKKVDKIEIDFENFDDRIIKLTENSSLISDAVFSEENSKLYYLSKFENGYDLWVQDIRKKETKLLHKIKGYGHNLKIDKKEENLYLISNNKIIKFNLSQNKLDYVSFNPEIKLNESKERRYMFEHVWRQVKEKFYDPELHDVDWNFYKKEYAKFLPHINNNYDFAEMLSEMLGELNASHTGAYNWGGRNNEVEIAALGVFYDWNYNGEGLKIEEVIENGPLYYLEPKIKKGSIIKSIDNEKVNNINKLYQLLNKKENKRVLLKIDPKGSFFEKEYIVKPISIRKENNLLYERWVENNRKTVEKISGGKLGYVHVRGMNPDSFKEVYSIIFGRYSDAKGIVIDTRFNGGGNLTEDLVTLFSGEKYLDWVPRGQHVGASPSKRWYKKSILVVSESNYSDAHGFPFAYKSLGIGSVVGMPVPGTMTAVWWERLQNNTTVFGIPQVGSKDKKGHYLENQQLEPDYRVDNEYEKVRNGIDQQLIRATEILLKQIKE